MKSQVAMSKKGKILLIWKIHVTMANKDAYISNNLQLQKFSSTFIHKKKSRLSATSILSRSSLAYKTTISLDKLTCIDHVDYGKCRERVVKFSWFTQDSNYLDVKLKASKKDDNKEHRLRQSPTMGEANSNQFMQMMYHLCIAAEISAKEENVSPVVIPSLSKDIEEQFKLDHKVVDVMDPAIREICVTLLRYSVKKPKKFLCWSPLISKVKGGR